MVWRGGLVDKTLSYVPRFQILEENLVVGRSWEWLHNAKYFRIQIFIVQGIKPQATNICICKRWGKYFVALINIYIEKFWTCTKATGGGNMIESDPAKISAKLPKYRAPNCFNSAPRAVFRLRLLWFIICPFLDQNWRILGWYILVLVICSHKGNIGTIPFHLYSKEIILLPSPLYGWLNTSDVTRDNCWSRWMS